MNEENKQLDNDFKKITKQYNMLTMQMGFESKCKIKYFFAIRNRYLLDEYSKLSVKYTNLLEQEINAKSSNPSSIKKLTDLLIKCKKNDTKVIQNKLLIFLLTLGLIGIIPIFSVITIWKGFPNSLPEFNKTTLSIAIVVTAIYVLIICMNKAAWSLKWLSFICSSITVILNILAFISPKFYKTNYISAIIIFYVTVQSFISWQDANLDWKNKVLDDIKQI